MNEKISQGMVEILDNSTDDDLIKVFMKIENGQNVYMPDVIDKIKYAFARFDPKKIYYATHTGYVICSCTKRAIQDIIKSPLIVRISKPPIARAT